MVVVVTRIVDEVEVEVEVEVGATTQDFEVGEVEVEVGAMTQDFEAGEVEDEAEGLQWRFICQSSSPCLINSD